MTKRILAMTLCLALTLLACACAASNATVSAPESTDNKGDSSTDLSTMEQTGTSLPVAQMSSQPATSDEVSAPTEPKVPEEKETTLELVQEISVGDGGIPITMLYEDDATYSTLEYPFRYFADEKGNIYYFWHRYFGNLQTGAVLEIPYSTDYFRAFAAYNGSIYALAKSGVLKTYTLEEGLLSSTKIPTRNEIDYASLEVSKDGTIVIRIQNELYDATGNCLSKNEAHNLQSDETLLSGGSTIRTIRKTQEKTFVSGSYYLEDIYYQFDENGNVLAAFATSSNYAGDLLACSIFDEWGKECKWYPGYIVKIESYSFNGVLFDTVFQGADNSLYLLLLYPDHADLYRINPGYSDVQFT